MSRALILGGTGVLGSAIARRLVGSGWDVEVTGRDPDRMPADLARAGVRFHASDRHDPTALAALVSAGADLLVDGQCFTGSDARQLLPMLDDVGSVVMLSSKAVYVDADGRHVNSGVPPRFDGPLTEQTPTMTPSDIDHQSREGYGANKVAAEQALLDSGYPVTVLRASKVHGVGTSRPREWMFVKRAIDRRPAVLLAHRGAGADHPTAAVNLAALVETVAAQPGRRALNCADPDLPTGLEIARIVADRVGHSWREVLLDDAVSSADPLLGAHPWDCRPPLELDTSAAVALGYTPVGTYGETVAAQIDWLVQLAGMGATDRFDDPFFAQFNDYAREDAYLSATPAAGGKPAGRTSAH